MNSFSIPGYVTLGDFVERAGEAMLKDEWIDAASVAAEQGLLASRHRRPQYEQVLTHIRTAFCAGEIGVWRLELLTGRIVEIPAEFWRSPLAETVFVADTTWIVPEPDPIAPVLLRTSEAEAWLALLDKGAEPEPPALQATAWFQAEVKSSNRCTRDVYCAAMVSQFGISNREARRIWDQEAPKALKRPGAPKRPNSVR